jgi:hypothetical protein
MHTGAETLRFGPASGHCPSQLCGLLNDLEAALCGFSLDVADLVGAADADGVALESEVLSHSKPSYP